MTRWFVSRHQGAIDWAEKEMLQIDRWVAHLDPQQVQTGDVVMGTLPVYLAAEICQRGATFYALSLALTEGQRGRELDLDEIAEIRCGLLPFVVLPAE